MTVLVLSGFFVPTQPAVLDLFNGDFLLSMIFQIDLPPFARISFILLYNVLSSSKNRKHIKSYFVLNYIIEHFCIMLGRNKNSGIVSYLSRVWIPDTATKYPLVIKLPQSKRIMVLVLFYLLFLTGIIINAA